MYISCLAPRLAALAVLLTPLLVACDGGRPAPGEAAFQARTDDTPARDDVVVIAVIDSSINPYHFDYLAAHMPQHLNADPGDDLPLDSDPSGWVPGYPEPSEFKRYTRLDLTLTPDDPNQSTEALAQQDMAQWQKLAASSGTDNADVAMYWFPGTKIIGHVVFGGVGELGTYAASSHGIGTSSVSAGNLHGSCPNCLLVYVHGTSEQANEWVARQDWIDAQTNSWGFSLLLRDRAYAGSDTELQRTATERGQSIFFSAGNGQGNTFTAPNTTLQSSQEGPDWIITVGAVSPSDQSSYSGHGKPADIASLGSGYPSANGSGGSTTAEGNFGGTSNSTPVIAGMYAEALWRLRRMMDGASRVQADGVIATGDAGCGAANPDCALADGQLTVHELREALFRAARYTAAGTNVGGLVTLPQTENVAELEFVSEGHGSYMGRFFGDETYNEEIERIVGFVAGDWFEEQDPAQRDWFIADATCRQGVWGPWDFGEDRKGPLPPLDPEWPIRSFLGHACPDVIGAVVAVERQINGR